MKKFTLFFLFILSAIYSNSQEIISTQGDSYSSSTSLFDFTIGESVIETINDDNTTLTQGFHQTKLTITNINNFKKNLNISIRPNPVKQYLEILISENNINYEVEIIDVNSKVLCNKNIYNNINILDFSKYKSGIYLIKIKDIDNNIIKTMKIQKSK